MVMRNRNAQPWHRMRFAPAGSNSVNPGAGSITLTGFAPVVAQSDNRAFAPGVANIAFTGYAPTITQAAGQSFNPGAAPITLTGFAPVVSQTGSLAFIPGAASLTVTGFAPSVIRTGGSLESLLVAVLRSQCPRALPDFAPFNTARPYVIYQFVGGAGVRYLDKTSNAQARIVQIDVWADGRAECNDLMRAIENALCAATTFNATPRGEFTTDADPESERYGAHQDFNVFLSS